MLLKTAYRIVFHVVLVELVSTQLTQGMILLDSKCVTDACRPSEQGQGWGSGKAGALTASLSCSQQPGLIRGPQTCTTLQPTDGEECTDFLGYLGGSGGYVEVVNGNKESKRLKLKFWLCPWLAVSLCLNLLIDRIGIIILPCPAHSRYK